jgi:hypothetical protein
MRIALEVVQHVSYSWRVSGLLRESRDRGIKEITMRKVLLLALVSMFFAAAACSKSEETAAPAPEASASAAAEASPAAAPPAAEASPAASPAAP